MLHVNFKHSLFKMLLVHYTFIVLSIHSLYILYYIYTGLICGGPHNEHILTFIRLTSDKQLLHLF